MPNTVFPFQVDSRFRFPLLVYGFTPARSTVEVSEDAVHIQFGPWVVDTPRDNIASVEITGPYSWWRVFGIRVSLADRGVSFGSSTTAGVCMLLKAPVSVRLGRLSVPLRHPGITVTVADPQGLQAALADGA